MSRDLYSEIMDAYYAHKYEEAIKTALELKEIKGFLTMKMNLVMEVSYLKLNKKEEALEYRKKFNKMGDRLDFKLTRAIHYNKHYLFMEAREVLLECVKLGSNNPMVYSYLGKVYFRLGDLEQAVYYFKKALNLNPDTVTLNVIKNTMSRIEDIMSNKKYVKMNYDYFKVIGKKLTPGLMVYVKDWASVKPSVPYLIYKVVDDKVYAFSLSSIVIPETYHLVPEKNFGEQDSYLTGNMVCFKADEIDNIVSEVYTKELLTMYKMLAYYYSFKPYDKLNMYQKEFLNDIKSNLMVNDITILSNKGNLYQYFFFVGYDQDNNYKGFRVNVVDGKFRIASDMIIVSKEATICSVIKLALEIKKELLEQIDNNSFVKIRK